MRTPPPGNEALSEPVEMYLKTIYRLREIEEVASTGAIAKSLGLSKGAVTNSLSSLERQGLVRREPYKGTVLTQKGKAVALRVLRKHRLAERLLTEIIGMPWEQVHDVACRLEHAITDDMVEALEKVLKSPQTCPHGNPVPSPTGRIHEEFNVPLSRLSVHEKAIVAKISDEKPDLLRYLASLGLVPGAHVEISEKAPFQGPLIVKVDRAQYALGQRVASAIRVKRP